MTDRELLTAAIETATGGNVSRFAVLVGVSVPTAFVWRAGGRPLNRTVRRVCLAILADPAHVVPALAGVTG